MTTSDRSTRIILSAPMWTSVRDLLRSDVFEVLKASGALVHIVSPSAEDPEFMKEFNGPGVSFSLMVSPPDGVRVRLESILAKAAMFCMALYIDTWRTKIQTSSIWRYGIARTAFRMMCLLPYRVGYYMMRALSFLRYLVTIGSTYDDVFNSFEPDLVVLNMPFWGEARHLDRYLLVEAKKRGVQTALVVASWDNLSSKGNLPCLPDAMLVWNDTIRDEAVRFHGMASDRVYVCGAPCHDFFVKDGTLSMRSRDVFCASLGLDPKRIIVTYACAGPKTVPDEHLLVEATYEALQECLTEISWQLLVRAHPSGSIIDFSLLAKLPNVVVDFPGRQIQGSVGNDMTRDDIQVFLETLAYSAVVVNFFSTFNIDAACMGCPSINVAFNRELEPDLRRDPLRFLGYNHISMLLSSGTVLVARNIEELIRLIRDCIKDRDRYKHVRDGLIKQQCGILDGHSGERTARTLLTLAERGRGCRVADPGHVDAIS